MVRGVEEPHHLDPQSVLSVVIEEQCLGSALTLVVAGTGTDRVHIAPVVLALGVDERIPVDLRGGGGEDLRPGPLRQAEHVDRAVHGSLGRLHRVTLIVNRRSRARKVIDLIDLDIQRKRHVVADDLEARIRE